MANKRDRQDQAKLLPDISEEFVARLQHVQDTGETLFVVDVDEAELLAVGLPALGRDEQASGPSDAQVQAGAERLLARGLAEPEPWRWGRVTPAGDLLDYVNLAIRDDMRLFGASSVLDPEPPVAERRNLSIPTLFDVVKGGLAFVVSMRVPVPGDSDPLPVRIETMRADVLVDTIAAQAFSPPVPPPAGGGTWLTVVLSVKGKREVASRLSLDLVSGKATLQTPRYGLLGARWKSQRVDRAQFVEHLKQRFSATVGWVDH